jgi:hypothetical protein
MLIPSPLGETAVGSIALMKKGLKQNAMPCISAGVNVGSIALMKKGWKPNTMGPWRGGDDF